MDDQVGVQSLQMGAAGRPDPVSVFYALSVCPRDELSSDCSWNQRHTRAIRQQAGGRPSRVVKKRMQQQMQVVTGRVRIGDLVGRVC